MLGSIFLFACLFPFVSPFPINSDIQPLAGMLAALVLFQQALNGKRIDLKLIILGFAPLLFLAYNNTFVSNTDVDLGRTISLLYGALILIAVYFVKDKLTPRLLTVSISIYFAGTIAMMVDPSGFIQFQNLFIRGTNVEMLGPNTVNLEYRGAGVFTSEAGLFGGLLVFMWLLVDYVKQAFNISNRHYYALLGMLVFMIIQSKSGTGYIYLIFYFALKLVFSRMSMSTKFLILIFGLGGLFQILPLISEILGGRGGYVLSYLLNPLDFLERDTSLQARLFDIYFSLLSLIDNPFGVGNNRAFSVATSYMMQSELYWSLQTRGFTGFGFNSSLAYLIVSYGIFYVLYGFYTYSYISKAPIAYRMISFLFLSVSYSAAFPAIWLLLMINPQVKSTEK